jgi:hypothetical protein
MITGFTASAAAQHQHTLHTEADQARLARVARRANHPEPPPVIPSPRGVRSWRRRVRTA